VISLVAIRSSSRRKEYEHMSTIRDSENDSAAIEVDETMAALREALADMQDGDEGQSLSDFDRDFRQRHAL
jgi:hypothetical protein